MNPGDLRYPKTSAYGVISIATSRPTPHRTALSQRGRLTRSVYIIAKPTPLDRWYDQPTISDAGVGRGAPRITVPK